MIQNRSFKFILLLFSVLAISVSAQKTAIYQSPEAIFRSGVELIQKEKYVAAQHCFEQVIELIPENGN